QYPLIRPITMFLKMALSRWNLTDASQQGIGGYALTILVAWGVMCCRDTDRKEDVFFNTLQLLSSFDFTQYGVTVRGGGTQYRLHQRLPRNRIHVDDPAAVDCGQNCAQSLQKWDKIATCLKTIVSELERDARAGEASPVALCLALNRQKLAEWAEFEALAQRDSEADGHGWASMGEGPAQKKGRQDGHGGGRGGPADQSNQSDSRVMWQFFGPGPGLPSSSAPKLAPLRPSQYMPPAPGELITKSQKKKRAKNRKKMKEWNAHNQGW
ncbi:hypothetical protein OC834_007903, partial [Tilletia horrida]